MQRVPVNSSNVRAVGYAETVLEVEFHGGSVYRYSGVPASVHASLMGAASKGRYMNMFVVNRYPTRRIR
ncbi:KTSC domain-containing protein [Streptomyces sp. NPDC004549]|uniref:KTSC domain-containing protein n=1 Tax=Streptomyces sp. NPDC004549 TaxID=3154283 RepID=UPI0033B5F5F9